MTRISFAVLGILFFACWAAGWATGANGWMSWGNFVAGAFSFKVSMAPVFTGDYRHDDVAPYGFALSIAAVLLFVGELVLKAPVWMMVCNLIIAALYLGLGVLYVRETHELHRTERLA